MGAIGLDLGGGFTRVTVLDAAGEVLEDGMVRSTEAGFRQRFACLPPSVISVQFDSRFEGLLTLLSSLGHSLLFCGPVSESIRPRLVKSFAELAGQGRRLGAAPLSILARCGDNDIDFRLWLEGESAWYAIGPVPPGTSLAGAELSVFPATRRVPSVEQAGRVLALAAMGEISIERQARTAAA